ncbi:tRNA (5-methylaminomethyl-2-thiouridine)(34)-methyltransferase MnmD [Flavitalea sp. BT771]|uniref:tRNA (5-methylaminomethyl-2-thiouridine)(34)-methyltransferase MnmD n=1 Tax=Flavitalea sp. BT771 TaxID=3063329 RepID=UPI0026E17356|nr:tRNA (5-methylaminomethyl-2-thiouridine)(34)-methyltransferase MnmD [Flavitalea sp. BT771]MDO6433579.1 tRNA (5-methylaminomethyl-2-thiouridine)(34)-methyltransferase MnmD [Flavitalea sp. BT771]MDV6222516.1 tRNA (5-methylaminomethyl-2-thiouridine)(34)-methyltransferase MnmD [Flavitalea sp. BT771]
MSRKIIITNDGSPSIALKDGVTYHSIYGAMQESQHIFIGEGWKALRTEGPAHIFEVGLGTGLNALLMLIEATFARREVIYEAVEAHPLELSIIEKLDYCRIMGKPELQPAFERLHRCDWEAPVSITPYFTLYKSRRAWPGYVLRQPAALVFYDAFDPAAQPELWTSEIFKRLSRQLAPGALLVTYSSKGSVRRGLQAAGFRVEKRPGPPGKREVIRAWRIP